MNRYRFMRWRSFLFISLGANILLASFWAVSSRKEQAALAAYADLAATAPIPGKTNFIVRRQFFTWQQVESDDYPTYITNLRNIGCPEQTIRDVIIADVNALYAKRRATELVTTQQQWWRAEPDPEIARIAAEKSKALDDERRALLAKLLGPNWESGDLINLPRPSRPAVLLDGPVLGVLPTETKAAVEQISLRAQERMRAYVEARRAAGKPPDPAELARLRQQTRLELAGALSPPQLEEYLLRYSETANGLRTEIGQLRFFNGSPDEFRAIFRATDAIDLQLQVLVGKTDPNSVAQRNTLEQQRDNAIKTALGPDRYREYTLLHDPVYRDAMGAAQEAGAPEAVQTLYQLNLATVAEQNRIQTNANFTDSQKALEIKRIELEQLKAAAQALGLEVPPEPPPEPQPLPTRTHVIEQGETIATLSLQMGVPVSAIRAANPNVIWPQLKPGDTIQVPQSFLTPQSAPMPR